MADTMRVSAAVVRAPGVEFEVETLDLDTDLRADEVLVRVEATGLCHTDLTTARTSPAEALPRVLGHEGAGTVAAVGSAVTKVAAGDRVIVTFSSCGACEYCGAGEPSYCVQLAPLNLLGARPDQSTPLTDSGGKPVGSFFFGQSSMADHCITRERNCVPVTSGISPAAAAGLGCGFQTGAGTVLRSLGVRPGSSIAVFGAGAVGLAAILAAKIAGAQTIVAVEPNAERRKLALDKGATHAIDPGAEGALEEIVSVTGGGAHYSVDCVGIEQVLTSALGCLRVRGTCASVGMSKGWGPNPVSVDHTQILLKGLRLIGVLEGDSDVDGLIPELVSHYESGRFPIDDLVVTYPLSSINQAVAAATSGAVVKPVLVF